MDRSEAARLHDKDEPRLRDYHLYSMLDMMGGEITCDFCGRWQRIPTLIPGPHADSLAAELGWRKREGKDACPICDRNNQNTSELIRALSGGEK